MVDVPNIGLDTLVKEGASQKDRIVQEVMQLLYNDISDRDKALAKWRLKDGTECAVVKFYEPRTKDGELSYGFDVKFGSDHALSHLEFKVTCTGWERRLR